MMQRGSYQTHRQTAAYHLVKDRLQLVERAIGRLADSDIPAVQEIGRYLHGNGGKRLRPALVLLCAQAAGYDGDDDIELGVIVEFIHSASLVHDDIVDGAKVRRGSATADRVWGTQQAVLFGDFLYARALSMSVRLGNLRVVDVLTEATSRLVEGEMLDVMHNGNVDLLLSEYMELIDRKTASLFAGCARGAAVLADSAPEQEAALAGYGHDIGLAFQLVDDALDYDATVERLGKEPGADLREGKLTYPLIHFLQHSGDAERVLAVQCLGQVELARRSWDDLLGAMRACGSLEATREQARQFADQAHTALAVLPDTAAREALAELPAFIVARGS